MAKVDPYLYRIPRAFLEHKDKEVRAWFEYDNRWKNDIWLRTGGGVDKIEDIEVTQVGEDGGNRTQRRVRDELDEMRDNLAQVKRQNRVLEQSLHDAIDSIEKVSRRSRLAEQLLNDALETISQIKRNSRLTEQKIIELTERHDNGT